MRYLMYNTLAITALVMAMVSVPTSIQDRAYTLADLVHTLINKKLTRDGR